MSEHSDEEKLAWLLAGSAIQLAQIKANPIPHLVKLQEDNAKLRQAIEKATLALLGLDDFDLISELDPKIMPNIVETATMRNSKALTILKMTIV